MAWWRQASSHYLTQYMVPDLRYHMVSLGLNELIYRVPSRNLEGFSSSDTKKKQILDNPMFY